MRYSDLPQIAQDLLQKEFLTDARQHFDHMEGMVEQEFLERPEIKALYEEHRDAMWEEYQRQNQDAWGEWLIAHDIDP